MSSSTGQLQGRMAGGEPLEVTSPGRIAECGKSGDGAAADAGRFQRGFAGAVGVFLLLTGGLKLVSVLQESRVLGAADPLPSWLTVRQVLFLAAGLELAVATVLLRHRTARWAPGLILWLVLVFGTYRLGLWVVGFRGHCGCLGHLFERWPEFERWADRGMLAALFVMGFGAVCCMALGVRRWRKRRRNLSQAKQTTGLIPRTITFSHLVGTFLLLAPLEGTAEVAPLNPDKRIIGARGEAKFLYLERNQQEHLRFEIVFDGQHASIRLAGYSKTGQHSEIEAQEFHFDGALGHTLLIWAPDLLVPKMMLDPVTGQPHGDSNTLVRPLNEGTMELRFSPIPKAGNLLPPWLAFASLPYLDAWSRGRMEKLFDLDRTQRRGPLLVPGVLKRSPQPPGVPELLITFDPRKRTLTNELFRVEEWQEFKGQTWPKRFVFELYQSHSEPKGRLLTVSEWVVDGLFVPEIPVTGKPQFPGRVDVKDERFNQDPEPLPIVGYFITNSVVPSMEAVRTMRPYASQVEYELSRRPPRPGWIWHLVFWPILVAPAIWYLVKRYNTRRNNPKSIPTS